MEDGVTVRFNNPVKAFKVTYNTVVDVINNCLDQRNVPNIDSTWRYDLLKYATVNFSVTNVYLVVLT